MTTLPAPAIAFACSAGPGITGPTTRITAVTLEDT